MNPLLCALLNLSILFPASLMLASNIEKEADGNRNTLFYEIPDSPRFAIKRLNEKASDIIYYLTKPHTDTYPIVIMCGGSSDKDHMESILPFHRYFLQELMDLEVGILTVELWGVDGKKINLPECIEHYTRSQRLEDHRALIEHIKLHPPAGWNGKLIFLGVSEGGPLVTTLTEEYADSTIATINWSGAGDWSWEEELWVYLQRLIAENPKCPHHILLSDCFTCLESIASRDRYEAQMQAMLQNPTAEQSFLNMTYKYHADATLYPKANYQKIHTPFLVVTGTKDTLIQSSDAFVEKAKAAEAPITYLREDMDHYIRKRPDIIEKSFDWLREEIRQQLD